MAISSVTYSSKEVQIGIVQEATFGTVMADATNFNGIVSAAEPGINIAEFDEITIEPGLTQVIEPRYREKPLKYSDDVFTSQTGGTRVITISGIVARRIDIAEFLYAFFQNVTEGAVTPYTKTYEFQAGRVAFSANAGYFCTIAVKNQITGDDEKYVSCICSELKFSSDNVGGDGRLRMDAIFISGFSISENATLSGTFVPSTQNYFDFNKPTVKQINSLDLVLYKWEINFKNNAKRVSNDFNGDAEEYFYNNPMEATWSLTTKYDANTQALKTDYLAGTKRSLQIATGSAGVAGHLDFDFDENILTSVARVEQEGQALDVAGEVTYDGTNMPTITLSDGKDQTW